MNQAAQTAQLLSPARSREPADRERLLDGHRGDVRRRPGRRRRPAAPEVQILLDSIFMTLVVEAERDIRARLAEKLADAAWAPPALINILALDEIEIARPIIARSPILRGPRPDPPAGPGHAGAPDRDRPPARSCRRPVVEAILGSRTRRR